MKIKPLSILIFLAAAVAAAGAQAPAPRTTAPASSGPVPAAKLAVINVAAFGDGIGELKQRYEKLRGEFGPKANEVESMQASLADKEKLLADTSKMTPQQVRKLSGDYEQLKKDLQRKQEDYQAQAQKREQDETGAIYEKINRFLEKYAQDRGITMVFEATALGNGLVLYAAPGLNVTDDFIKEYNKAHPAAAAAASPAARKPPTPR